MRKVHRYYQFEITKRNKDLTDREVQTLEAAYSIVANHVTIRSTSNATGVPKSTIHDRLHVALPTLSPVLYDAVVTQLHYNRKHPRKGNK